ncbi:MAG: permease [candidate division Zixibacteria bacterium]|nr:permease [candidate division Zixibacteria bacterium]
MEWKREWKPLTIIIALFLVCFYLPVGSIRFDNAIKEALYLTKWYAREHVLLCLIPAFFIAGAISVFVSQASVMKYLGAKANKVLAYGVASVSGTILAVCSCTVLPLFAGIYKMGAGLGPATAFLYSGPAINVLAIVLTARVLGLEIGIARAVGAISFSIIIGLLMHFIFRKEEAQRVNNQTALPPDIKSRALWRTAVYFALLVGILVFANWGKGELQTGLYYMVYNIKWIITAVLALILGLVLIVWFKLHWWKVLLTVAPAAILAIIFRDQPMIPFAAAVIGLSVITSTSQGESRDWFDATWGYTKQIMPLLLIGVLLSGAFLGRPGQEGLIPSSWISASVGGNSVWANFFASIVGAFMYFATLTEVPILQGLIGSGMGKGPALALLLAGPALSLPSMLVLRSIMGTKKTVVYVVIVVIMATITGLLYGAIF